MRSFALALFSIPLLHAQGIPAVDPLIVSAWKSSTSNSLLIFRYDGTYFHVNDATNRPGFERGNYAWTKSSGSFSATPRVDTDGTAGLSHPGGVTTLAVAGNTLTYSAAGSPAATYSRVLNSGIVGSWHGPGGSFTVTFLSDLTYYLTDRKNDVPFGYDGIERGTYTWSAGTGNFTATPLTDTNGDIGLSNLLPGFKFTVSGNVLTYVEGTGTGSFQRVTTNLSPFPFPDFDLVKGADYVQTSDAAPVPATGFPPFFGAARIGETVGATAPSLKIGTRTARNLNPDVDTAGRFEIDDGYTTVNLLNANSAWPTATATNYVFRSGSDTATLNFPTGGSIPVPPRILDNEGFWDNGSYSPGDHLTLAWTTQPSYNAATHLTLLEVTDVGTDGEVINEIVIQGEVTSYDFSGQLEPGKSYRVALSHARVASTTTGGGGVFAGKLGMALYEGATEFLLQVPSSAATVPIINEQPVSQVISPGATAHLTVGATQEPVAYQWFRNGTALPGQTGNSLSLRNFQSADVAAYHVTVTTAAGSVTSNPATLILPTTTAGPQTITFPAIPPQTPTSGNQVPAIAAGEGHSLFVKTDGSVWATGKNANGQLGDGGGPDRSTPVQILSGISQVSAHYQNSLFLKADGSALAAGWNQNGQLGTGDTQNREEPFQVLSGVISIAAGERHSLFVKSDGSAWATGGNFSGQLGTGDEDQRLAPVQVLTGVAKVAAGLSQSFFLKTDGSVWACGENSSRQLGTGDNLDRNIPVQVLTGVTAIAGGGYHTLFLKTDGSVWACGENGDGALATGDFADRAVPVQVMTGVTAISAGETHSLFLKTDGSALGAGYNGDGQLGLGNLVSTNTPTQVLTGVRAIGSGLYTSFFALLDGTVHATGYNGFGQFGIAGPSTKTPVPVFQAAPPTTIALAADSTSGLPISYTVLSGPATVSGNILTLTGTGTVVVRASQAGNVLFTAATPVQISITVSNTTDPFASFVSGLPAGQRGNDDDPDHDGVANLLEYLLGGNPALPATGILPTLTSTAVPGGRTLVFTYQRKLAATGVTQVVEHTANLAPPWTAAVHGQNGVTIAATPVNATTEQVTVTIPSAGGTRFVRLKATR